MARTRRRAKASLGARVLERGLSDKRTLMRKLVVGDAIGERVRPVLTPRTPTAEDDRGG